MHTQVCSGRRHVWHCVLINSVLNVKALVGTFNLLRNCENFAHGSFAALPSIHLVEHGQSALGGQFQRGYVGPGRAARLVGGADTQDLGQPLGGEGFDKDVQGHLVGGAPGGQGGEHLPILNN